MSVDSELRSAEVMLGVDLTRLRDWWRSPIQDGHSLDGLCEHQRAAKLVTQGLKEVLLLRNHRFVGNIVREHLRFAARLPDEPYAEPTFAVPFWLIFLQQAAQAVFDWTAIRDEVPAKVRGDFVNQAWNSGRLYIGDGFPKAAVEIWRRLAGEFTATHQRAIEAFRTAEGDFERACALAAELQLACPAAPPQLTTEGFAAAVLSWRNSVLRGALDELFWQAQRPGLERVTFAPGADMKRRAQVKALLRSCDKHCSPDLLDCESLAAEAFVRMHGCAAHVIAKAEARDAGEERTPDFINSLILWSPPSVIDDQKT